MCVSVSESVCVRVCVCVWLCENVCVGGWERAERADTTERLVYPEAVNLMVNKFKVVASASAASLISGTCK